MTVSSDSDMLSMIIRTNLIAPDILINSTDKNKFNIQLEKLITEASDPSSIYYIKEDIFYRRLIDCTLRTVTQSGLNCPLIFDSWSCYNSTLAGTMMWEYCPDKPILNFDITKSSSKYCTEEGTWWVHPNMVQLHWVHRP